MSNTFLFGFGCFLFNSRKKCASAGMFWLLFNNSYSIHSSNNILCFFLLLDKRNSQKEAFKACGVEWGSNCRRSLEGSVSTVGSLFLCREVSCVRRWSSQTQIYFGSMMSLGSLLNTLQLSSKLINPSGVSMAYIPNTKAAVRRHRASHRFTSTFQGLQQR